MKISKLEEALKTSWNRDTSSDPENWSQENPAHGQCAVTSLIVNDYFGGEIIWANAVLPSGEEVSHYFNKIDDKELDLTRIQFPLGTIVPQGIPKPKQFETTREYVLSYQPTQERYELLRDRVSQLTKK